MQIEWKTEKRNIKELIPAEYNPRKISDLHKANLSKSIEKFNIADPIIINKDNKIIGGHQRLKALLDLGIKEVDVRVPSVLLDEQQEKELNLRLNKNTGEWDFDLLANFEEEMLKDVGFESAELDKIFATVSDEKDDVVPETPEIPKAVRGDIYQLGRHRVMCGDSISVDDVDKLMDGKLADLVLTDPPYNTGMEGKDSETTRLSHMFKDRFSPEEWSNFLNEVFNNYFIFTKGECAFYVFIDWRRVSEIKQELEKRMDVKNVIVWDKGVHGLGSDYKFTYELCVVGKKGKPEINNRFGLDYQDIWRVQRGMGRNKDHATSEPVELFSKPITHASKRDDIVLDLFLGSGTTLIASEKNGRCCYGIEIEPKYVDVIIKRWEDYTGQKAVKLND